MTTENSDSTFLDVISPGIYNVTIPVIISNSRLITVGNYNRYLNTSTATTAKDPSNPLVSHGNSEPQLPWKLSQGKTNQGKSPI